MADGVVADTRIAESHRENLARMQAEAIADGEPDPEAAYAPVAGSDPTLAAIAKAATTMASLAVPKPQAPPVKTAAQIEADVAEARAVEVDTVAASIADDPGLVAQWAAVRQARAAKDVAAAAANQARVTKNGERAALAARIAAA